jgi:hypothetical protein
MTDFEKRIYKPATLCELCAKACGGCSWSKYGVQQPVEGWTAIRCDQICSGGEFAREVESYVVVDCPEFELEEKNAWAWEKFDREYVKERVNDVKHLQEAQKEQRRRRKAAK